MMTEQTIEIPQIIKKNNTLDKQHHKEIYKLLRKSRPPQFFATCSGETRFNIYMLNKIELNKLDALCDLCAQSMESIKYFSEASKKIMDFQ